MLSFSLFDQTYTQSDNVISLTQSQSDQIMQLLLYNTFTKSWMRLSRLLSVQAIDWDCWDFLDRSRPDYSWNKWSEFELRIWFFNYNLEPIVLKQWKILRIFEKICFEFFDPRFFYLFILTAAHEIPQQCNFNRIFSIPGYCCARQYARLKIALLSNIAKKYCPCKPALTYSQG